VWLLSGLLAAVYLLAGGSKLAGAEQHVQSFARWGWPDWMRLAVGTVEVVSAALLLVPRVAFFGATALMVVMAGAIYTHLFRAPGEAGMAVVPLVLLGLNALVARARRHDRRGRRSGPEEATARGR
jgi:uncharacterized membrane protein YphA (DoxX/SURF4 family)